MQVKANATLVARAAKVGGNIQAENHDRVVVRRIEETHDVVLSTAADHRQDFAGEADPYRHPDDETADDDYLSLMGQNLDALRKANGCQ